MKEVQTEKAKKIRQRWGIDAIRRETEDKSFLAEYERVVEILKKRLRKKRI